MYYIHKYGCDIHIPTFHNAWQVVQNTITVFPGSQLCHFRKMPHFHLTKYGNSLVY